MRKLFLSTLTILALAGYGRTSQAFLDLTVEDKTVNPGALATLSVFWSSTTALDYLTTEFIITAVGSAPAGEVVFTNTSGVAPMPPLGDTNYVFAGNSDDSSLLPNNPTTVYQTNWSNDSYNFADSTTTPGDYAQDGSRLWTILNLDISSLAAGQYQITLGSSEYTNTSNPKPNGIVPLMTGGLITINAVPEPSTYAFAIIASFAIVGMARRKQK